MFIGIDILMNLENSGRCTGASATKGAKTLMMLVVYVYETSKRVYMKVMKTRFSSNLFILFDCQLAWQTGSDMILRTLCTPYTAVGLIYNRNFDLAETVIRTGTSGELVNHGWVNLIDHAQTRNNQNLAQRGSMI